MSRFTGECSVEFSKYCRCKSLFESKYLRWVLFHVHSRADVVVAPIAQRVPKSFGKRLVDEFRLKLACRCFPHCCPSHVYNSVCGTSIVTRVHGPVSTLQNTVTYLRFDASYEKPLEVGDTIDEDYVLKRVRRNTHSVGEWIASHYDVVDEKTLSRVCEFSPKAQSTLGWHYRWVGGSARQQRRAVHYLRAYVFVRESPMLRVVAVAQSTPFIVMSYRRACKVCQRQTPEDSRSGLICQCEGIYRLKGYALTSELERVQQLQAKLAMSMPPPVVTSPSNVVGRKEDALATIHFFITSFPASVLGPYLSYLDMMLRKSLDSPLASPIFSQIVTNSKHPSQKLAGWTQTMEALGVAAGVTIQLLPFLNSFSVIHAPSLLNKHELERSHETAINHIFNELTTALAPYNTSPHALADEILVLCAVLHADYPDAATICLQKCEKFHTSVSFKSFVAQMRESFMSHASPPQLVPSPSNRPLDGCWRYRSWSLYEMSPNQNPSVLTLIRGFVTAMTINMVRTSDTLFMRSQQCLAGANWSEFHLDGSPHVLRTFPSGEATMACFDGLLHGDYVAEVRDGAVYLSLYSWPASSMTQVGYTIHIRLEQMGASAMAVDIRVIGAPGKSKAVDYWCMTVDQRLALYDATNEYPVVKCRLDYEKMSYFK
ncbi:unnamed protein product [Aphanomyces euteiches]